MVARIDDRREERNDDSEAFAELERALRIDEHALEEELQMQPDLYYRVSRAHAVAISRRDAAKQRLEECEAEADLAVRRDARDADEKINEGEIKSRVKTDKRVKEAAQEFLDTSKRSARLHALMRSFEQRNEALKSLVHLYIRNYYGDTVSTARRDLHEQRGDESRGVVNERRRQALARAR